MARTRSCAQPCRVQGRVTAMKQADTRWQYSDSSEVYNVNLFKYYTALMTINVHFNVSVTSRDLQTSRSRPLTSRAHPCYIRPFYQVNLGCPISSLALAPVPEENLGYFAVKSLLSWSLIGPRRRRYDKNAVKIWRQVVTFSLFNASFVWLLRALHGALAGFST